MKNCHENGSNITYFFFIKLRLSCNKSNTTIRHSWDIPIILKHVEYVTCDTNDERVHQRLSIKYSLRHTKLCIPNSYSLKGNADPKFHDKFDHVFSKISLHLWIKYVPALKWTWACNLGIVIVCLRISFPIKHINK